MNKSSNRVCEINYTSFSVFISLQNENKRGFQWIFNFFLLFLFNGNEMPHAHRKCYSSSVFFVAYAKGKKILRNKYGALYFWYKNRELKFHLVVK